MATKKKTASTKKKIVARPRRTKRVAAATTGAASAVATVQQTQGKLRIASTSSAGTPGAKDEHEVVVVRWDGPQPLSLQGWQVRDKGADHAYTFGDVTLQPRSTIRVHSGGRAAQDTDTDVHWVRAKDVWNEKSDVVHLLDSRGVVHAQHIFAPATRSKTGRRTVKSAKKTGTIRAKRASAKKSPASQSAAKTKSKRAPTAKKPASRVSEAKRTERRPSARQAKPPQLPTKKRVAAKALPKSPPEPLLQKSGTAVKKSSGKKTASKTSRAKAAASRTAKTRPQQPASTLKATRVKKKVVAQKPPRDKPETTAKKSRPRSKPLSDKQKGTSKSPLKKKAQTAARPKVTNEVPKEGSRAPVAKTEQARRKPRVGAKSEPATSGLHDKLMQPAEPLRGGPQTSAEPSSRERELAAHTLPATTQPTGAVAQTSPAPVTEQPSTQRSSGWPSDWKLPKPLTPGGIASFLGGLALASGIATVMPSQTDVPLSKDSLTQLAAVQEQASKVATVLDKLSDTATSEELVAKVSREVIERQELTKAVAAVEKTLERVHEAETLKSLTILQEALVKQAPVQGIAPSPDVAKTLLTGQQPPSASAAIALAIAAVEKAKERHCGGGLGQQSEDIDRAIAAVDRALELVAADNAD